MFDNKDAGIQHNIEIKDPGGTSVFKGAIITGEAVQDHVVAALPAARTRSRARSTPNMTGALAVGS